MTTLSTLGELCAWMHDVDPDDPDGQFVENHVKPLQPPLSGALTVEHLLALEVEETFLVSDNDNGDFVMFVWQQCEECTRRVDSAFRILCLYVFGPDAPIDVLDTFQGQLVEFTRQHGGDMDHHGYGTCKTWRAPNASGVRFIGF